MAPTDMPKVDLFSFAGVLLAVECGVYSFRVIDK